MSWENASDFEINKAIAKAEGFKEVSNTPVNCVGVRCNRSTTKSYCNSWQDMGPIIERENISLVLDDLGEHTAVKNLEWFNSEGGGYCGDCEWYDKNPLRASAIVYLMSKGVDYVA